MQRLLEKNINSPSEYEKIYWQRREKGVDEFDRRRWETILKYYKGGKLCDLGALDSQIPMLAKIMSPRAEVWGLDHAKEAIEDMQTRYPNVFWHVGDLYNTRFPQGYFDFTVLGEVLEHLEDPYKAIIEAKRITKKRGMIAISVPLNEAIEPGAVDKFRHLWSYEQKDIEELAAPYTEIKFEILRSTKDRYCFPQLLAWIRK